jgi:outer membrane receptor protein involved in Fe transport
LRSAAGVEFDGESEPAAVVEVVGRSASGVYHAGDAAGAKTEMALHELPQAVRVMTRQALDDLGATRLDDVLDYAGGVSRQNSFGGLWDNIAIRGLAGDPNNGMALLQNGFSANRGGINAPRDTANIERIEFLKGPAAALYGASERAARSISSTSSPCGAAGTPPTSTPAVSISSGWPSTAPARWAQRWPTA